MRKNKFTKRVIDLGSSLVDGCGDDNPKVYIMNGERKYEVGNIYAVMSQNELLITTGAEITAYALEA